MKRRIIDEKAVILIYSGDLVRLRYASAFARGLQRDKTAGQAGIHVPAQIIAGTTFFLILRFSGSKKIKERRMKKKTWLISGITILAVIIAGLIFLYSNLDYIIKTAIERYGPRFTQTAVRVGSVKLTLRSGECKIKRFLIGNPKGFKTDYAFKTDLIDIGIQPASITKKVLHIRKIIVLSPQINYESQSNSNNFETIQRNIEKSMGAEKKTDRKSNPEKSPEKKMIVDTLILRDVRVTYTSALVKANLTLPSIEMYNIGKNKGGVTGGELAMLVVQTLSLRIGRAVGISALKNSVGSDKGSTTDLLKGLLKQ